jgi:non-canonical (house-cleaning) NTP pyrophosphatase
MAMIRGLRSIALESALVLACDHWRVLVSDVLSGSKRRPVSGARTLAVCVLRARNRWSYTEIAHALGISAASCRQAFWRPMSATEQDVVFRAYQAGLHG